MYQTTSKYKKILSKIESAILSNKMTQPSPSPGESMAQPNAALPTEALDIANCWKAWEAMDQGTTLFLPGLVVHAWFWANSGYMRQKMMSQQHGVTLPVEPISIEALSPVDQWLKPGMRGTAGILKLRKAIADAEILEKNISQIFPLNAHYNTAVQLVRGLRDTLRSDVYTQLPMMNQLIDTAPTQLWVGLKELKSPRPEAAAMLSRFAVRETDAVPPMLVPVLKDICGSEGSVPYTQEIAGLFVSPQGERFPSDGE